MAEGERHVWQEIQELDEANQGPWARAFQPTEGHEEYNRMHRELLMQFIPPMVPANLAPTILSYLQQPSDTVDASVQRPIAFRLLEHVKMTPAPDASPRFQVVQGTQWRQNSDLASRGKVFRRLGVKYCSFSMMNMSLRLFIGDTYDKQPFQADLYQFLREETDAGRTPAAAVFVTRREEMMPELGEQKELILDRHTGRLYGAVIYHAKDRWHAIYETYPALLTSAAYQAFMAESLRIQRLRDLDRKPTYLAFQRILKHIHDDSTVMATAETQLCARNILELHKKNIRRIVLPREEVGTYLQVVVETKPNQLFKGTPFDRLIAFHITKGTTLESVEYTKQDQHTGKVTYQIGTFVATLTPDGQFSNRYSEHLAELQAMMQEFNADPVGFLNRASKSVGVCWVCAKALVSAESIEQGMGKTCAKKMHDMEQTLTATAHPQA